VANNKRRYRKMVAPKVAAERKKCPVGRYRSSIRVRLNSGELQ
jgi:hypothetical protein